MAERAQMPLNGYRLHAARGEERAKNIQHSSANANTAVEVQRIHVQHRLWVGGWHLTRVQRHTCRCSLVGLCLLRCWLLRTAHCFPHFPRAPLCCCTCMHASMLHTTLTHSLSPLTLSSSCMLLLRWLDKCQLSGATLRSLRCSAPLV